jgi:CRISPR/Cas system CSM-associated protein Csm3 (group 7 of RAMP superfamily)
MDFNIKLQMNKRTFTIAFLSDWHIGSGLGSGPDSDAVVLKNQQGLPYVPGKTLKGLLRDACHEMHELQPDRFKKIDIDRIFGVGNEHGAFEKGNVFFSNSELVESEILKLKPELVPYLFRNISRTGISKDGTAIAGSLRTIEVCVPMKLEGFISDCDDTSCDILSRAMQWINAMGVNRNRGLGRCKIFFNSK